MVDIPASAASGTSPQQRLPNRFSEMSTEDFIRVIFTELSNQDPFEPNDSAALLQQLSSIRSIESDIRLTEQLQTLVRENQLSAAGNLIGKYVEGLTSENDRVSGKVIAVLREDKNVKVELESGYRVSVNNIDTIVNDPGV